MTGDLWLPLGLTASIFSALVSGNFCFLLSEDWIIGTIQSHEDMPGTSQDSTKDHSFCTYDIVMILFMHASWICLVASKGALLLRNELITSMHLPGMRSIVCLYHCNRHCRSMTQLQRAEIMPSLSLALINSHPRTKHQSTANHKLNKGQ